MSFELKKEISSKEIAMELALEHYGKDIKIKYLSSFDNVVDSSILFVKKYNSLDIDNCCVIAPFIDDKSRYTTILSKNPRMDFIKALNLINSKVGFIKDETPPKITSTAIIAKDVTIENGCIIGKNTVIEPRVVILNGTKIGDNCLIRAGAIIGSDGFGFERDEDGTPIKFIHLGSVIIGDNVEIGANSCIARGTLSDTKIDSFSKIDNLVHIAHNCHIKSGALITACAELSGGVIVEKNSWIGPNVSVIQKVKLGENSLLGIGTVVLKDVTKNSIIVGNPGKKIKRIKNE